MKALGVPKDYAKQLKKDRKKYQNIQQFKRRSEQIKSLLAEKQMWRN